MLKDVLHQFTCFSMFFDDERMLSYTRFFPSHLGIRNHKWKIAVLLSFLIFIIYINSTSKNVSFIRLYQRQTLNACEEKTQSLMKLLPKSNFTYPFTDSKSYKGPIVNGWPPSANRNISAYISKDKDSFLVLPRNVSLTSTELLIMIRTRIDGFNSRNFIRFSWGRLLQKLSPTSKIVFVLGKSEDQSYHYLDGEIEYFGDILQADFIDSYNNLTLKTLSSYKYISQTKWINRPKMIVNMDDDVFINFPLLVKEVQRLNSVCDGPYVMGCLAPYYNPIVDNPKDKYSSKWGIPSYILSYGTYPAYVKGFMSMMSFEAIECIYQEAFNLPYFHIEDIFTTGFCAKRCGITPKKSKYDVSNYSIKDPEKIDFSKELAILTSSSKQHMKMCENLVKHYHL